MVVSPRRDDLNVSRRHFLCGRTASEFISKSQRGVDRSHGYAGYVLWGGVWGRDMKDTFRRPLS
jgi:hypothetical protein